MAKNESKLFQMTLKSWLCTNLKKKKKKYTYEIMNNTMAWQTLDASFANDIKCKLKGLRVSKTHFLSNHQQNWTHSQDLTRVSSVDLTCVHSPRGKQSLAQHKKHFCVSYTCEVQGKTGKDVQCNVLRLAAVSWSTAQQETRDPLSTRTETTGLPS